MLCITVRVPENSGTPATAKVRAHRVDAVVSVHTAMRRLVTPNVVAKLGSALLLPFLVTINGVRTSVSRTFPLLYPSEKDSH